MSMGPSRELVIQRLIEAGYTPESTAAAVQTDDLRLLVHPSRYQVRLAAVDDGGS